MLTTSRHWQRALKWIQDHKWDLAEGELLYLLERGEISDPAIQDALGYSLLMQGEYYLCEKVLLCISDHPNRSFWVNHKIGDALRGQHQLAKSALWYEKSLLDGSNHPLTYRNLIQVLWENNQQQAMQFLESWLINNGSTGPWLEGAQMAADLISDIGLCFWLQHEKISTSAQNHRLFRHWCYELNINKCYELIIENSAEPWAIEFEGRLKYLSLNNIKN
jgi:hypothetical protein